MCTTNVQEGHLHLFGNWYGFAMVPLFCLAFGIFLAHKSLMDQNNDVTKQPPRVGNLKIAFSTFKVNIM